MVLTTATSNMVNAISRKRFN